MIIITTQCFFPKIGGIESLMTGMAEAMADSGKKILVVADGIKSKDDELANFSIKRFNHWKPFRRIYKANFIRRKCKVEKIEAIYADSWKSIEYLKNINVPKIVLAHGTEIQKNYTNWNIYKRYKQRRIYMSYMLTNKIVANSNYTKELLEESLDIHKEKIEVIHPGVDVYDEFIQQSTIDKIFNIIKGRSPVILTLARLENRKGHKIILQALAKLINEYPNLLYIIAGDGPTKQNIKKIVSELNLNNRTSFLGWISEHEKSVLLKNADLFVMTPHVDKE